MHIPHFIGYIIQLLPDTNLVCSMMCYQDVAVVCLKENAGRLSTLPRHTLWINDGGHDAKWMSAVFAINVL